MSPGQRLSPHPSAFELRLHAVLAAAQRFERRFEPFFRPAVNRVFRAPSVRITQWLINRRRRDEGFALAEERPLPGEDEALDSIIASIGAYMHKHYEPGEYQRGGNTKTHGVLRAEVKVRDDVPAHLRHGVFAKPETYRAWVRFSGPARTARATSTMLAL
jgi:hypothetical protein